jgi:hypothetical protein
MKQLKQLKTYAIEYKNSYYQFTQNRKDLDTYKNNKITNIVELEIIKNENGKYWLFECENDDIIIDSIEIMFKGRIKDKIGKEFKIELKEI